MRSNSGKLIWYASMDSIGTYSVPNIWFFQRIIKILTNNLLIKRYQSFGFFFNLLTFCFRNDHKVWKCWTAVTWFSDWKKSLLYAPMGVIPIIWPHKLWLSYVAGGQLMALSLFHLVLTFKTKKKKRRRKDRLLHDGDSFERLVFHSY